MKNTSGKRSWFKGLVVVEIIVCYMALLTMISYARGPETYRMNTELFQTNSGTIISFAGETTSKDNLWLVNDAPGTPTGYSARISLMDADQIHITFQIDCPIDYMGNILHVDLYDQESNYDNDEQQVSIVLQEGMNTADLSLEPGDNHPLDANLRIFTLDPADYGIQDLSIFTMKLQPKVSVNMIAGVVACLLVLVGTGGIWYLERKKFLTDRQPRKK